MITAFLFLARARPTLPLLGGEGGGDETKGLGTTHELVNRHRKHMSMNMVTSEGGATVIKYWSMAMNIVISSSSGICS